MIGAIENAILGTLAAYGDAGALGYRFKTLETYPEDWNEYFQDKAVLNAPAAWVVFAGAARVDSPPLQPVMRLTFGLVVMAQNARNETATRHGGPVAAEPGSYQLAEDAIVMLAGSDLGLDIGVLEVRSLRLVNRLPGTAKASMIAIELTSDVMLFGQDLDAGELPDFATFHADWDVAPFGNVDADPAVPGVQLPADASADASDHLPLETQ